MEPEEASINESIALNKPFTEISDNETALKTRDVCPLIPIEIVMFETFRPYFKKTTM